MSVGSDNQDGRGRFTHGNKAAAGRNRTTMSMKESRRLLLGATTPEMLVEVWLVLYLRAKEGNMGAIREFLDRTCGKPEDDELQERVEQLEALLAQHR
jgi:hypothetical protein